MELLCEKQKKIYDDVNGEPMPEMPLCKMKTKTKTNKMSCICVLCILGVLMWMRKWVPEGEPGGTGSCLSRDHRL